ncbi:hypothetical protein [Bifidobacterium catenulatum]|uniref:hypothetical protein n=1 Tax=Bifidobacterium catenulatum TaxID=1686 RepID=UPI0024815FB9|nr:hypothetical protein [Bifidobacterium catenulatum]
MTIIVTLGRVFFDSLAGYALSRIEFRGRNLVFALLIAVCGGTLWRQHVIAAVCALM